MMKLAVFACLLVVCCAQPPQPPPELPETFVSETAVFRKRGPQEERGQGKWDRSVTKMSYVRMDVFKDEGNHTMLFESLGLFASHMEYHVLTDREGKKECEKHDIPEGAKFPVIWAWLINATFHKFEDHRTNKTYDAWTEHGGAGESRTLLVDSEMPTKPVAMMSRRTGEEEDMRFMSFEAMEPDNTVFTVPVECNTPPPPSQPKRQH